MTLPRHAISLDSEEQAMASAKYGLRPTFLVIGAYKAGTTSLHHYLKQHPQVFMSRIKEIRFLTYAGHQQSPLSSDDLASLPWPVKSLQAYEALFAEATETQARGDVSPCYLAFAEQSVLGIQAYIPDAKLIAILRQPADRAYSSYVYHVSRRQEEELDFRRALQYEAEHRVRRMDGKTRHNFAGGFYFDALRHYFQGFPRNQIQICLYDDLQKNARGLMRDIFHFIGVDESFIPNMAIHHNTASWPSLRFAPLVMRKAEHMVSRIIRQLPKPMHRYLAPSYRKLMRTQPPPLDADLRRELTALYRDDILRTQDLIGRNLTHWLEE
ncbi:sulfotransferase [Candidatus Chloroploca sp. M-50]|uniref:Sulfotransferase n=1 Tax=Candidatus Chloroploca mongolica TaxID=2528176 RepID=A0ABS4D454_9CHLR|nr:sulfotransferase domain-containing protein [Candidatus Chloroploca mongolica]MBP1464211.1 sulfotransferase [Candidatus Chloroploca mongolica]